MMMQRKASAQSCANACCNHIQQGRGRGRAFQKVVPDATATRGYRNFANDRVFGKYSGVDAWIKWKRNAEET